MSRLTEYMALRRLLKRLHSANVPEPRVILDVGARFCRTSVTFARKYPNAKVFAFEANPESFQTCQRKARSRGNLAVTFGAVHQFDGEVTFYQDNNGNPGASSLFRRIRKSDHPTTRGQAEIKVPAMRLDTWAKKHSVDRFDLVWMDLQGAELLALQGMGDLLDTVAALYLEVEFVPLYHGQPLFGEVDRFLVNRGFECLEAWKKKHGRFGDAAYIRRQPDACLGRLRGSKKGAARRMSCQVK